MFNRELQNFNNTSTLDSHDILLDPVCSHILYVVWGGKIQVIVIFIFMVENYIWI